MTTPCKICGGPRIVCASQEFSCTLIMGRERTTYVCLDCGEQQTVERKHRAGGGAPAKRF